MKTIVEIKTELEELLSTNPSRFPDYQNILKEIRDQQDLNILLATQLSINSFLEQKTKTLYNRSPLMQAALRSETHYLDTLPDNISQETLNDLDVIFGNTPLMWAIANGNNEFAYKMIEKYGHRLDFFHKSQGNNPISLVLAKGYVNKTRDNTHFDEQYSALNIVRLIKRKSPQIFEALIKEVDDNGNSALHIACARRDVDTIKFLLDSGAENSKPNNSGQTPIDLLNLGYKQAQNFVSHITTAFTIDKASYESCDVNNLGDICSKFIPNLDFEQSGTQTNYTARFKKQEFITGLNHAGTIENSRSKLSAIISKTIARLPLIRNVDKKTIALLDSLGEYAEQHLKLNGNMAGFSAWKNDQNFTDLLLQKLSDQNLQCTSISTELLSEFSKISATLQRNSCNDFGTINGRKYGGQNLGARSFRLGILYREVGYDLDAANQSR